MSKEYDNKIIVMAKRFKKRNLRYGSQSGCMRGLVSMLDFRHGRPTQKLISDGRPVSRHVGGSGTSNDNTETLPNLDESCTGNIDGEETIRKTTDIAKPSVKKLIEEEMCTEQDAQKENNNAEDELKWSNLEQGNHKSKIHKNMKRSRSKRFDLDLEDLNINENLQSEVPCLQNPDKQCECDVAIEEMMEEFCRQIHQKSSNYAKRDQRGEVPIRLNRKNPEFEEKLIEAINRFVNQKLINEKKAPDAGDPSKELRDALQILISDEELFLKLLRGPKSVMLKHVQNLCNDYAKDLATKVPKDKESKSLAASNPSVGELCGLRQPDGIVHNNQCKFYGRRAKYLEETPSKEFNSPQTSNTIIILKPGTTGLQHSETDSSLDSSPQSHSVVRNKVRNERVGAYFSLSEIKRKLKRAMGKERQVISSDDTSKKCVSDSQATRVGVKGSKESVGKGSLSKDHFFFEKIAKPPIAVKKGSKPGKMKEHEIVSELDTTNYTKQRVSNIYIEAKKHLSEMLSNGNGNVDFPTRQAAKPLGKILSLPQYNASPIPSPGRNRDQSITAADMRLPVCDNFQKQESNASHLSHITLNSETQSCVFDDNTDSDAQSPLKPNSSASCELVLDTIVENTDFSMGDKSIYKGNVEIVKSAEIVAQAESNVLDTSSEMSASCITRLEQTGDTPEPCSRTVYNESLKHDFYEENQLPSSPFLSPSTSAVTKNVKDPECVAKIPDQPNPVCVPSSPFVSPSTSAAAKNVKDPECVVKIPDRPSPVCSFEPLYLEDDFSLASIRSQPVEPQMQPQRIQFQEHDPSATDESIPSKIHAEDEELIFEYVKAVLQISRINWDELNMKSYASGQLLDQSILNVVEYSPNQLCLEKELLFDCINEVLIGVLGRYFGGCPGLSFVKSIIRPVPDMKNAIREVWDGVYWHLLPLPLPHNLDQIVKKDMAKSRTWMDLLSDAEIIVIEIVDDIFDDLIEETLFQLREPHLESKGAYRE